ncbi:MAG: hypothetical protein DMF69_18845 [Acidobacteria bacterium]|nr:MAG: hypothetical protein DMF69_18845 [Acidobacteriota bacterium]
MHVTLRTGDSTAALNQFFELYQTLRPEEETFEREIDSTLGPEFATTVTHLDMLPTWLFEVVLEA